MKKRILIILAVLWVTGTPVRAQMHVASVFSDHMILQRDKAVPVWGEAGPGERIIVKFCGQTKETVTGKDGKWEIYLDPMPANAEGHQLTVTGDNTLSFDDILVGDIWIMAGQSNMFRNVKSMGNINKEVVEKADNPMIRFYKVPPQIAEQPQTYIQAKWGVLNSNEVLNLTAIGSIFAEQIQPALNIPLGILSVNMGSTTVECWVPEEIMQQEPFLETWKFWEKAIENWDNGGYEKYLNIQIKQAKRKNKALPTRENMIKITETRTLPSGAYNAMLYPLFPFAVKGVVWRQGEANAARAVQYEALLPVMIKHWREKFMDESLPFIQTGLPAYGTASEDIRESVVAELRAAQQNIAQKVENCYYIPLLDLHDIKNNKGSIHPKNKYLAGCRVAAFALGNIYRIADKIEIPLLEDFKTENGAIVLTFKGVKDGLYTGRLSDLKGDSILRTDEQVHNFIIAGKNKKFVRAEARIVGKNSVRVWSENIKNPVAVRYAWKNLVLNINLYNGSGMPVSSFRTDNWHLSSEGNYKPRISIVRPK